MTTRLGLFQDGAERLDLLGAARDLSEGVLSQATLYRDSATGMVYMPVGHARHDQDGLSETEKFTAGPGSSSNKSSSSKDAPKQKAMGGGVLGFGVKSFSVASSPSSSRGGEQKQRWPFPEQPRFLAPATVRPSSSSSTEPQQTGAEQEMRPDPQLHSQARPTVQTTTAPASVNAFFASPSSVVSSPMGVLPPTVSPGHGQATSFSQQFLQHGQLPQGLVSQQQVVAQAPHAPFVMGAVAPSAHSFVMGQMGAVYSSTALSPATTAPPQQFLVAHQPIVGVPAMAHQQQHAQQAFHLQQPQAQPQPRLFPAFSPAQQQAMARPSLLPNFGGIGGVVSTTSSSAPPVHAHTVGVGGVVVGTQHLASSSGGVPATGAQCVAGAAAPAEAIGGGAVCSGGYPQVNVGCPGGINGGSTSGTAEADQHEIKSVFSGGDGLSYLQDGLINNNTVQETPKELGTSSLGTDILLSSQPHHPLLSTPTENVSQQIAVGCSPTRAALAGGSAERDSLRISREDIDAATELASGKPMSAVMKRGRQTPPAPADGPVVVGSASDVLLGPPSSSTTILSTPSRAHGHQQLPPAANRKTSKEFLSGQAAPAAAARAPGPAPTREIVNGSSKSSTNVPTNRSKQSVHVNEAASASATARGNHICARPKREDRLVRPLDERRRSLHMERTGGFRSVGIGKNISRGATRQFGRAV